MNELGQIKQYRHGQIIWREPANFNIENLATFSERGTDKFVWNDEYLAAA